MVDITALKQAVHIVLDEHGEPVAQVPLSLWETLLNNLALEHPQHERILALLAEWDAEPDDTPAEWWDEFDIFLSSHRLNFQDFVF